MSEELSQTKQSAPLSNPDTFLITGKEYRRLLRQSAENERVRAALMRLANEVRATTSMAEHAIRESAGNTNYQCLMDAESEARAAIVPR